MYHEYKGPLYAAPPLLQRMVDAGLLGRKSGRGFYQY
jgi:3-hydroxybutyryl-CoA dehydrogenase